MKKYTECDKMLKVRDQSQTIGEFLDWVQNEKGYTLCERNEDRSFDQTYFPARFSMESILAEFFGINLNKVEKERRAMLADLRKQQGAK